ncbi:hypothetical protein [Schlegelella aquatica]|uniref:hypothetical protein n=1 Tax=Caldimonas aquatica TaxID=376175 RepID=UPI0037515FBA
MNLLRRNIPRLAALVLLLWLFVAGVAFAQACATTVHPCLDACGNELSAAPAPHEPRQDAPPSSTTPWTPAPQSVQAQPHAVALARPAAWRRASEPAPPERIPILFLRLAL